MSKIDIVSFWNSSGNIGMAPYVNTSQDGGHIDYEGVYSKVDLNTRIQSIVSALPDFFESYRIILTDVNLSGVLVSKAECVLKASSSSDVPDYTQILTRIANSFDTNVTDNIVNKLTNINIFLGSINTNLENISNSVKISNNNSILSLLIDIRDRFSDSNGTKISDVLRRILLSLTGTNSTSDTNNINGGLSVKFSQLVGKLQQSVSPKASITDVISALNATIDSKQDTTIVNNEVTPLAEINIDVPFEVKNLKKSDVEL